MTTPTEPRRATGRDLHLVRWFDASPERVFRAWTDPERMAQWWGPHAFTVPHCELDPRPGGTFHVDMGAPDGAVLPNEGVFVEVEPPERLTFEAGTLRDDAGVQRLQIRASAEFRPAHGGTELTLRVDVLRAEGVDEHLGGMEQGWVESLEKLTAALADGAGTKA